MKLSTIKDGQTFLTDTDVKFIKLLMTKAEIKRNKDRFKCRRIDSGEVYWLTDSIIIRNI